MSFDHAHLTHSSRRHKLLKKVWLTRTTWQTNHREHNSRAIIPCTRHGITDFRSYVVILPYRHHSIKLRISNDISSVLLLIYVDGQQSLSLPTSRLWLSKVNNWRVWLHRSDGFNIHSARLTPYLTSRRSFVQLYGVRVSAKSAVDNDVLQRNLLYIVFWSSGLTQLTNTQTTCTSTFAHQMMNWQWRLNYLSGAQPLLILDCFSSQRSATQPTEVRRDPVTCWNWTI